jgi:RNA polymerase primary sigma factor
VKTTTVKRTAGTDALSAYLSAIRTASATPLSREEEHDLAVRARRGDAKARHELVQRNLALVVTVARNQQRGSLRLEELVQEGNLGLLRAAEKFDPDAGTRFSTYAVWWIRAYVWKYLKEARSSVRPRSGTTATSDLSLDSTVGDEGDTSYLEGLEDEAPKPDEAYASAEGRRRVQASLDKVRKRVGELGWDIIRHRLQQDPPDTLETIGKRWGVSRERVRQVELQTKRFLRGYLVPANGPDAVSDAA